jgi:PAS domain S-box-containing protein
MDDDRAHEDLVARLVADVEGYAILLLDLTGNVMTWNTGARRLKGYEPEEIIGRHFSVFYPPADVAAGKPARELEIAAAEGRVEDEGWRLRQNGSAFWASVVITALRDPDGTLRGYGKVTRDLTERRVAELALHTSEERRRLMVEGLEDYAILTLDPEGLVTGWTARAHSLKGYKSEDIIGRHFSLFYPSADVAAGKPARELEIAAAEGRVEDEGWRVRQDGTRFWANVVITALRDRDGTLRGYGKITRNLIGSDHDDQPETDFTRDHRDQTADGSGAAADDRDRTADDRDRRAGAHDVESEARDKRSTARDRRADARERAADLADTGSVADRAGGSRDRRAAASDRSQSADDREAASVDRGLAARDRANASIDESELQETNLKLRTASTATEEANRAKSEFLSRMSHELRTPLNAILGFGQLLERSRLEEREHVHVEYILKGGRHLLALIDEVLAISRIEAGSLGISVEPVLAKSGVEDVLEMVGAIADERGILVEAELSAASGEWVMADLQRLKQVLLNLLSNAIKYNRPAGTVRLSIAIENETVIFAVSDTGPGIADEDLPRLFVPFDRLGAEASVVEGTGLGLALSRRLAEAMGGSLDARSSLGAGSTFELRLPRGDPDVAPVDRAALETISVRPLQGRVLYVEDNISNLRLIELMLADECVEIIAASTGRLALDLAPGARADLILLDMNLPDMSGDEVLLGLRASPPTATTPVIVLTADASTATRRRMLELGASAHLTKPIDLDLLKSTLAETDLGSAAPRRDVVAGERGSATQ